MLTMPGPLDHLSDTWGWGTVTLRYEHCPVPPAGGVSNVHLLPFVGDECLVCRVDDGEWILPGGTLEDGEEWQEAAARELLEEAGARMLDVTIFGALRCHDAGDRPWRQHLPWPDSTWLLGWAEVEVVGAPSCPVGGECIVEVRRTSVQEAASLLAQTWPGGGDLCRLAGWLRTNACCRPCGSPSGRS